MDTLLFDSTATWEEIYPFDIVKDGESTTIETSNNFIEISGWDDRCE